MVKKGEISLKLFAKRGLLIFLLTIVFFAIIILFSLKGSSIPEEESKIIIKILFKVVLIFLIIIIVSIFLAYFVARKNPEYVKKMQHPKKQRGASWVVLIYGVILVVQGIYLSLFNKNIDSLYPIIETLFGLFAIVWAIYFLRKNKRKNNLKPLRLKSKISWY
jgi:amino acid transporter